MVQKRIILVLLSVLLIVAGCSGAKYGKEKTVLDGLTKAIETFTSAVNSADTPSAVTSALGSLTGTFEKFLPQMKSMTADHPEWEANPPKELKETFDKFNTAKASFQNIMPKLTTMAQENMGDADLQSAMNKFISLVKDM